MTSRSSYSAAPVTTARRPLRRCSIAKRLLAPLAAILVLSSVAAAEDPPLSLRVDDLLALQQRCGSEMLQNQSFELAEKCVFAGMPTRRAHILAYEENRLFIYAAGWGTLVEDVPKPREIPPLFGRWFVFLKPQTFVVLDIAPPEEQRRWLLRASGTPEITGNRAQITEKNVDIRLESLLPQEATLKAAGNRVEVAGEFDLNQPVVFLHVLDTRAKNDTAAKTQAALIEKDGRSELTVSTPERVFRLTGTSRIDELTIAITTPDEKVLLPQRLLPAGILPHGPDGVQMLQRWDSSYQGDRRPGWDTGRPSSELKKAVESGTVKPGKAVVLGCGTGTNAIYLAGKGFDVTGIDIAPTALARAKAKADKAGVKVRWVLADVLNLPMNLGPVDFIFDRGCYHGVRRGNAAGALAWSAMLRRKEWKRVKEGPPQQNSWANSGSTQACRVRARTHAPALQFAEPSRSHAAPALQFAEPSRSHARARRQDGARVPLACRQCASAVACRWNRSVRMAWAGILAKLVGLPLRAVLVVPSTSTG